MYADLHEEFKENDVLDQLVSAEPQWYMGNVVFSLPLKYIYSREDNESSYHRYTASPTITVSFPEKNQAIEFYGTWSQIEDVDEYPEFDEDGRSFGGGMSYLFTPVDRHAFRVLADYQQIDYDSRAWDYLNETTSDKRHDMLTSLGAEHTFRITDHLDFMARYTFVHTHSNVDIYDYDQHIVQAGMALHY